MTQAIFYQVSQAGQGLASTEFELACALVARCYSNKQRISVYCANQADAERFDELLWQLPAERFIAHNLANEGPKGGALVEVTWPKASALRNIVVNLSASALEQPQRYSQIYDFVPEDDTLKQAARERYKTYKLAGCSMQFLPDSSLS